MVVVVVVVAVAMVQIDFCFVSSRIIIVKRS